MEVKLKAPKATKAELKAAEVLERRAAEGMARAAESFDKHDTDGFVSQWASNVKADERKLDAEILRNGRHATFTVLWDTVRDSAVDARQVIMPDRFRGYGTVTKWVVDDKEVVERCGTKWIPTGKNSRKQKQYGLQERKAWFPAVAVLQGNGGTGLSAAHTVRAVAVRREEAPGKWNEISETVEAARGA